jgi:hypothetical protein
MKKILFSIVFISAASSLAGTDDAYFKANGGMAQIKGKGTLVIVDCRNKKSATEVSEGIAKLKDTFNMSVRYTESVSFSFSQAKEQLLSCRGNACVFIADNPDLPMTLCASEENWALINTIKLATDNPKKKVFTQRLNVLLVRQGCRILGADETKSPESCFRTIQTLADLDSVKTLDISMNAYLSICEVLSLRGIEPFEYGTYLDACELGIAPSPTNDIQKAIWDKVHAAPKNPMKIEFDPKKGR